MFGRGVFYFAWVFRLKKRSSCGGKKVCSKQQIVTIKKDYESESDSNEGEVVPESVCVARCTVQALTGG